MPLPVNGSPAGALASALSKASRAWTSASRARALPERLSSASAPARRPAEEYERNEVNEESRSDRRAAPTESTGHPSSREPLVRGPSPGRGRPRVSEVNEESPIPGPDGSRVFTSHGVVTAQLKWAVPEGGNLGYCLPAVWGNYFLSLTSAEGGRGALEDLLDQ